LSTEITITDPTARSGRHIATVIVKDDGMVVMRTPGMKTLAKGEPIDADKPLWRQIERLAARLAAIEEIAG
jgi:hypothetical protein